VRNRIYTHGQPGSAIPGSRLVRDYCVECGEPMRVSRDDVGRGMDCDTCGHTPPSPHAGMTDRQWHKLGKTSS